MKRFGVVIVLVAMVLIHVKAYAIPLPVPGLTNVTFDLTDNMADFSLLLEGGPVLIESTMFTAGTNWHITLGITTDEAEGTSLVAIQGSAFHVAEPNPPQGVGDTVAFTIAFLPVLDPAQGISTPLIVFVPSDQVSAGHGADADLYTFAVTSVNSVPNTALIADWSVLIQGTHASAAPDPNVVPEPGSFILLGTGLLGVFGYGWRRGETLA